MNELFGTDGIRGLAGQYPLDERTVERIGYSLARELKLRLGRSPEIIIGRDTRESGEWIESAIVRGLHTAQAHSQSAGIITTPGVAYLTRNLGADAGIVISASHNPYQDNGIKVFAQSGQKIDEAMEQSVERDLRAVPSNFPTMTDTTPRIDLKLKERYFDYLQDEAGKDLSLRGLKLVIDCANGASYELAPRLFESLGSELIVINAGPNGRNINLDCGSLYPEQVQRLVEETQSDLGLAFDGDADRLLMVDEHGRLIDGDQILFIVADYLFSKGKLNRNRVVATVMSNLGLELALKERGIDLFRAPVGDKYVLDELLKGGGSIGGEQSGHIIFPEISLAGDGMITALEVLRVMAESKSKLGDLANGLKRYPQVTLNVNVSRKPPLETVPVIKDVLDKLLLEIEGKGRLLVRYSGTENKARVMVEGLDKATIQKQAAQIAKLIEEQLGS